MQCAAHEAVEETSSREATMIVAGFSLCEACGVDAVHQVVAETRLSPGRSPAQVVADEIAKCVERGFL